MFYVPFINLCNRSVRDRSSTSTNHTHEGVSFRAAADQPKAGHPNFEAILISVQNIYLTISHSVWDI